MKYASITLTVLLAACGPAYVPHADNNTSGAGSDYIAPPGPPPVEPPKPPKDCTVGNPGNDKPVGCAGDK